MDNRETRVVQMILLINKFYKQTKMNESKVTTKDPICGMTVDVATALHTERDGQKFYFCGDHCLQKFLSTPAGTKPVSKSGNCCG